MKDPITLPSSRAVVDRSTIKSHLLSDSKDPFNRVPLKIEEVIPSAYRLEPSFEGFELTLCSVTFPDTELKARIDAFLADKREKRAQKMDTD
jgi:ubiquitin conjugation factor E4 B